MTEPTDPADERSEQAFRDALQSRADELEPAVLDVRRPRGRVLPLVAAAAAVVVVAAASTVVIRSGGDGSEGGDGAQVATEPTRSPGGSSADPPGPLAAPAAGWQWVSTRGVAVQVPDSWVYGNEPGSDWCAAGGNVDRLKAPYADLGSDNGAVDDILCTEDNGAPAGFEPDPVAQWAPHVTFGDARQMADATVSFHEWQLDVVEVRDIQIRVLTDGVTRPLVRQVLDSARSYSVDQNRCQATSPIQAEEFVRPPQAFDVAALTDVRAASLCLYRRGEPSVPGLLGSRRITGNAAALAEAIANAPVGGGPDSPQDCAHDLYGDSGTVVRFDTGGEIHDLYVYADWCFGNGFDDGTNRRELTEAACMPIFAEAPVQLSSGSSEPFERCVSHSYR